MKTLIKLLFASCLSLSIAASAYGDEDTIVVIVNDDVRVSSVAPGTLRLIFQTSKLTWEGGKALPLNLPRTDPSRKKFDQVVLGMDEERVLRYWIDRKIRGGNPPPKQIPDPAIVVKIVAQMEEAIGYVPRSAVRPGVKVVAKIQSGELVGP